MAPAIITVIQRREIAVLQKHLIKPKMMAKIKYPCVYILAFLASLSCYAQNNFESVQQDFTWIVGNWKSTLTYLDYSTGKPFTMPANATIVRLGERNKYAVSNIYPNESSANSSDTIIIAGNGKKIKRAKLKSRLVLANGDIEIVTNEAGQDGNDDKLATFRINYTIADGTFKIKKEVQFMGETQWFVRHEYSYARLADN